MFFFLAFCFMLAYFAVAIALAAFIISHFFKNKKAAFLEIAEKGLLGSLIGLVLCLFFSVANPHDNWIWVAITATAAGIAIGTIKAKEMQPNK
jgi:amino acid transporter